MKILFYDLAIAVITIFLPLAVLPMGFAQIIKNYIAGNNLCLEQRLLLCALQGDGR
ncbi:7814_t:CDS:2, partial [Racocetra persica]